MSAGDKRNADTTDEMETFGAALKADLGEQALTIGKTMQERRRDAVRSKGAVIARYIRFATHLVNNVAGPLVFLARDALPLKAIADHIATQHGKSVVTHEFALTRAMLPKRIQNLTGDFAARQTAIRSYLAKHCSKTTRLHRFITQELKNKGVTTLIDTGFWGTCTSYASIYMELAHGVEVNWRLLFGPCGSPAEIVDDSEEGLRSRVKLTYPFRWRGISFRAPEDEERS